MTSALRISSLTGKAAHSRKNSVGESCGSLSYTAHF